MPQRLWLSLGLALLTLGASAQWTNPTADIPAYHVSAPEKTETLPPILSGKQLTGPAFTYPWQVEVYKQAARIPNVLYQLPCYCRCDRALGHHSLRSCFEGLHGAECGTCAKEEAYAYRMTRKGWTPQKIREGIERGDWRTIELKQVGA